MKDYYKLTLSDFYSMEIMQREDGSLTPVTSVDDDGRSIGLYGFKGDRSMSDIEIKEAAYFFYKELINQLKNKK